LPKIHPLAHVDASAEIAEGVEIGPFCVVESGVIVGARTRLESHAVIKSGTSLGEENYVGHGVVLGADPQDRKYGQEQTFLRIGNRNLIREYVTIHKATGEGRATVVGDDNFLMAYSHLGHNCRLENTITIANSCAIGGHVTIEDLVTIGGIVGIHQYVRVGRVAMIGGFTKVTRDVPPYMLAEGEGQEVHDINAIGLRRQGVTPQTRLALHKACKLLFKSQLGLTNALETVRREVPMTPEVEYLIAFEERRFKGKNGRGDQP
jgi:UDP-N-acetylglucosamine acyltransferase